MSDTKIPAITHPLGRYWEQPDVDQVTIDSGHAMMTTTTMNQIADYTGSEPSGMYVGKMWRRLELGRWFLYWFDHSSKGEQYISLRRREILLVD